MQLTQRASGSRLRRGSLLLCFGLLFSGCAREEAPAGDGDLGSNIFGDSGLTLVITPANPVIIVEPGKPIPTVSFVASVNGNPVSALWSTDRGELGAIAASGVYTPLGSIGGKALIRADHQGLLASTTVTVQYKMVENGDPACGKVGMIGAGGYGGVGGNGPGCVATPAQQTTLAGVPTADAAVRWLYPYDATVWPRGLLAPLLQWDPGAHSFDSLRLQMTSAGGTFVYDGIFSRPAGAPFFVNLPIPQATWTTMNYSASGDTVTVVVTFGEGASAIGPVTLKWTIAAGTLKGIVYYNSYGTALVTNSGENDFNGAPFGAATLAIKAGNTDPVLVAGVTSADNTGCRVCHSVSKDGSRLITQRGDGYQTSRAVDLKNMNVEGALAQGNSAFPALYPDGSMFFTSAGGVIAVDSSSRLYDLPTGNLVTTTGLPADLKATLPAFSPDGSQVVFNHFGGAGADQKSLATMSFDLATKAFGPVQKLITPPDAHPAVWPSFLPTNKGVAYEVEVETHELGFTRNGNKGALWWVDVATKQAHALDQLNGASYLPTGPAHMNDAVLNYEPTVNPVASGGYVWVVFTSRRLYGNVATIDPFLSDPRGYDWKNQPTPKKLWVAALDLNAQPGTDPSHPAFYLPAQELHAGNSRGFWTVDPCRMDGSSCETGDECCGGYCQTVASPDGGSGLICSSEKPLCAKEYEKCVSDADCCTSSSTIDPGSNPNLSCINGYCVGSSGPIL